MQNPEKNSKLLSFFYFKSVSNSILTYLKIQFNADRVLYITETATNI